MINSLLTHLVYGVATTLTPNQGDYILDDPHLSDIAPLLTYIIDFMLGLSGGIAIFFVFLGASQYIWGFDVDTKQKGKTKIFGALAGLVVVTLSFLIVRIVTDQLPRLAS
ncbi:hypothetical protein KBB08_03365 [Candidatus Gracilibacteria bacterium]|nr:hypothetical protein [Candidatus Gracilibacteria bacterium]